MKDIFNRIELKNFFRKGQFPTEVHFGNLIDSMINKKDDGFDKTAKDGLRLSATGDDRNVLSVFKQSGDPEPNWQMSLKQSEDGSEGLSFDRLKTNNEGKTEKLASLTLANNGHVGIGAEQPRTTLEVGGVLGTKTRVGTYNVGQVDGNGQWQDILTELKGIHAFEIVARIDGPKGRGKYALTHAIAVSVFGGGKNTIRQTRAYYGFFWNRIELRWHGNSPNNYKLQMRTYSNYGLKEDETHFMIRFHVTSLWDDTLFTQI